MAGVCRDFGVFRNAGYKSYGRYRDCGLDGLCDRSRLPYRHANQLPFQVEKLIFQVRRERPGRGAPKIREKLRRQYHEVQSPAISTAHAFLFRHGLVNQDRRLWHKVQGTALSRPLATNDVWCADYMGEFMLAEGRFREATA